MTPGLQARSCSSNAHWTSESTARDMYVLLVLPRIANTCGLSTVEIRGLSWQWFKAQDRTLRPIHDRIPDSGLPYDRRLGVCAGEYMLESGCHCQPNGIARIIYCSTHSKVVCCPAILRRCSAEGGIRSAGDVLVRAGQHPGLLAWLRGNWTGSAALRSWATPWRCHRQNPSARTACLAE